MKLNKVLKKVGYGWKFLPQSRLRKCRCCDRLSIFVALSEGEECHLCLRCRANLRYEMLATVIRAMEPSLNEMTILELDSRSPLKAIMSGAKAYHRSFYSPSEHLGMTYADGTRCEDITRLTFADSSLDLIVSSDVLEHVPDLQAAFQESNRVLRPGGSHIFTVPTRPRTRKRAELVENTVKFLVEPEYHTDPLNPSGILAFWDFGPDAGSLFASSGLNFTIVAGPEGKDERIVWKATKSATL